MTLHATSRLLCRSVPGPQLAAWIAVVTLLPLVSACDLGGRSDSSDSESPAVEQGALEESTNIANAALLGQLAFDTSAAPSPPATPEERRAALEAYVQQTLTCGETTVKPGGAMTLVFGQQCQWNGKHWEGEVSIRYTSAMEATVTLDGVFVDGATLTGTLTASLGAGSDASTSLGVNLTANRTTAAGEAVATSITATVATTDAQLTIQTGTIERQTPRGDATLTANQVI